MPADIRDTTTRPRHAPADHPALPRPRVGILIANLGTPDGHDYWSMRRYLNEFLSDKRVVDIPNWKWQPLLQGIILTRRPFTSGANYRLIWNNEANESPLLTITKQQVAKLQQSCAARWGDRVMVDYCMRYGNPSTEVGGGPDGQGGLRPHRVPAAVSAICRRHDRHRQRPAVPRADGADVATLGAHGRPVFRRSRLYRRAWPQSVERTLDGRRPQKLVASYHGMPKRYLMQGDPYHCQCQKTTRLLRERLGWPDDAIDTTFQSVFGREEWLKPYTVKHVAELAERGITDIAVISPAFSTDCIETLEEINGEIREAFEHAGGKQFTYVPCLNDDDAHIAVLTDVLARNLGGWV